MKQNRLPDYKRSDDPSEIGTFINSGIDKCLDLKYGEGMVEFNKVLELDPENVDALHNKAVGLLKWGFDGFIVATKRYTVGIEIFSHLPNVREDSIQEIKGFLDDFIRIIPFRL